MHKQYICDSPWFSNAYFAPVSWGQGQQWCLEPWWPILPRRFPKSWGVPPVIIHFHRIFIGFSTIKSKKTIQLLHPYLRGNPPICRDEHLQQRRWKPTDRLSAHCRMFHGHVRGLPLCAPTFCRSSCARRCSSNVGRRTSSNVQNHSSVEQNWSRWP
jgi:hypothetical protein